MTTDKHPPLTGNDDELLDRLQDTIASIIAIDAPDMPDTQIDVLTGHLTGAVYVTIRNAR